jgi:hypothetical protein
MTGARLTAAELRARVILAEECSAAEAECAAAIDRARPSIARPPPQARKARPMTSPATPACYQIRDPATGLWLQIPGCYAGAQDPAECTCDHPKSELDSLRAELESARNDIDRLQETTTARRLENRLLARNNAEMRQRIRQLRGFPPLVSLRPPRPAPGRHPKPERPDR